MAPRTPGAPMDSATSYRDFLPDEEKKTVKAIHRLISHNFPIRNKEVVLAVINATRQLMRETRGTDEPENLPLSAKNSILKHNKHLDDVLTAARKSYGLKVPFSDLQMEIDRQTRFLNIYEQVRSSKSVTPDNIYVAEEYGFFMNMTSVTQRMTIKREESRSFVRIQGPHCAFAILCVSQRGKFLSPYVIERNINHTPLSEEIPGIRIATSTTGLPELSHTMDWMKAFDKSTETRDKAWRMLIVDGYRFNITPELEISCRARQIMLLSFPKKTYENLNPFHRGILEIFDDQYEGFMAQRWAQAETRNVKVDLRELISQIGKCQKVCSDNNHKVLNAWRQCFLFPVNPEGLREELEKGVMGSNNASDADDSSDNSLPSMTLFRSDISHTVSTASDFPGNTHHHRETSFVFLDEAQDSPVQQNPGSQEVQVTISKAEREPSAVAQSQTLHSGDDSLLATSNESCNVTPRAKFRQKLDLLPGLPPAHQRRVRDELAADYCTLVGKYEALEEQLRYKRMRSEH